MKVAKHPCWRCRLRELFASGFAIPLAAVIVAFIMMATGCATVQKMTGSFSVCEKADLGKVITVNGVVSDVEQAVAVALNGGTAAIPQALEGVAVAIGSPLALDTIDCAISAIESAIPSLGSGSTPATAAMVAALPGPDKIAAGRAWVAKKRAGK